MSRKLFLLVTVQTVIASPAFAQSTAGDWSGFIAVGPGLVPDYDGADQYRVIPFAVGTLRMGDYTLELRGAQARLNLVTLPGIAAGPVVNIRLKRDDDAGGRVAMLNEIDTAVEAGAFVGLRYGGDANGEGELRLDLTALADVSDAHDGITVNAAVIYALLRRDRCSISVDAQANYGSAKYMRTYFGITPAEAARSGLAAYRPDRSLRDIGAGVTIGYQFNSRWGVLGRASYGYLVSDAADSPIVRDEGSRHQALLGLGLSYRF